MTKQTLFTLGVHLGLENQCLKEHLEPKAKNLELCAGLQWLERLLAGLRQKRNPGAWPQDSGEERMSNASKLQATLKLPGGDAVEELSQMIM